MISINGIRLPNTKVLLEFDYPLIPSFEVEGLTANDGTFRPFFRKRGSFEYSVPVRIEGDYHIVYQEIGEMLLQSSILLVNIVNENINIMVPSIFLDLEVVDYKKSRTLANITFLNPTGRRLGKKVNVVGKVQNNSLIFEGDYQGTAPADFFLKFNPKQDTKEILIAGDLGIASMIKLFDKAVPSNGYSTYFDSKLLTGVGSIVTDNRSGNLAGTSNFVVNPTYSPGIDYLCNPLSKFKLSVSGASKGELEYYEQFY